MQLSVSRTFWLSIRSDDWLLSGYCILYINLKISTKLQLGLLQLICSVILSINNCVPVSKNIDHQITEFRGRCFYHWRIVEDWVQCVKITCLVALILSRLKKIPVKENQTFRLDSFASESFIFVFHWFYKSLCFTQFYFWCYYLLLIYWNDFSNTP